MKVDKRLDSIYTSNHASVKIEYESGKKEVHTLSEIDKIKYIKNLENWEKIYNDIIDEIIKYGKNQEYNMCSFKHNISEILKKIDISSDGISMGSMIKNATIIIPENTTLYRCVDSPNHCFANPHPIKGKYERLTDPSCPKKSHTFYLSFDENVAKKEAIHNNVLVKYHTIKEINVGIIPNRFPIIKGEIDKFFEQRLRKICNSIFSLTTKNNSFKSVEDKFRLSNGIYATTNKLFDKFNKHCNKDVFIYPSTKVDKNSELGSISNNQHFLPNRENANIAIFNDVHFNENGEPYSNYVKVDNILNL